MTLFRETKAFLVWYGAILARFLRLSFVTTVALVLSAVIGRVSKLLARLLPIKVILLASADGIPSYFQRFLDPDQKVVGLIVLSIGAIFFLCADILLNLACQALAERGSRKVVESANDIVLTSQREQARANYIHVTQIASEALFAAFGMSLIISAAPHLLAFFLMLLIGTFLFSAWALRENPEGIHRPVGAFIQNDLGAYLDILAVFGFVVGFIFILIPFFYGSADVVLALFAITFLRRTVNAIESVVVDAAALGAQPHKVNALVFRDHQHVRPERADSRLLRELFGRSKRSAQADHVLSRAGRHFAALQTEWRDQAAGVHSFVIETLDAGGARSQMMERIFPRGQISQLDKEEFLFRELTRETLLAPAVLTRFTRPPFECQVMDFGEPARPVGPKEWSGVLALIIEHLWSIKPPASLIEAHRASHMQLHDRLNDDFFERVSLAVNSRRDEETFAAFSKALPSIRETMSAAPMYIANPALNIRSVMLRKNATPIVLDWGRWMIEPIGHGQLPMKPGVLDAVLERVRAQRDDVPRSFGAAQLLLIASCAALERAVERNMLATALRIAGAVIHTASDSDIADILEEDDEETETATTAAGVLIAGVDEVARF